MFLYFVLFYLISSLAILSSIFVILANNPVFSALFLVLSFCNVSSLLFFLKFDFLPIVFLVVYVGAIAVLFLFVLMMLNIKIAQLKQEKLSYIALIVLFGIGFLTQFFFILRLDFNPLVFFSNYHVVFIADLVSYTTSFAFELNPVLQFNNMLSIGQLLFVEFTLYFIIVAYILLLAMIAAITSTLNKKFIAKSQFIYAQVLRSFDKSVIHF
jgi:NADH-quinone oxidoreductase subunit J